MAAVSIEATCSGCWKNLAMISSSNRNWKTKSPKVKEIWKKQDSIL